MHNENRTDPFSVCGLWMPYLFRTCHHSNPEHTSKRTLHPWLCMCLHPCTDWDGKHLENTELTLNNPFLMRKINSNHDVSMETMTYFFGWFEAASHFWVDNEGCRGCGNFVFLIKLSQKFVPTKISIKTLLNRVVAWCWTGKTQFSLLKHICITRPQWVNLN